MQDENRWHEILAAPSALATGDLTLEWAISESVRKTFGLGKESCTIAMHEYRKFRYLCDIAEGPILPSPLIAFVQARDIPKSSAFAEIKRWSVRTSTPFAAGSLAFAHERGYQQALDLYRQEFNQPPMPEIWPSLTQARQRYIAMACAVAGAVAIILGKQLSLSLLSILGCTLLFPAVFFIIFFQRHWGEPRTDS